MSWCFLTKSCPRKEDLEQKTSHNVTMEPKWWSIVVHTQKETFTEKKTCLKLNHTDIKNKDWNGCVKRFKLQNVLSDWKLKQLTEIN